PPPLRFGVRDDKPGEGSSFGMTTTSDDSPSAKPVILSEAKNPCISACITPKAPCYTRPMPDADITIRPCTVDDILEITRQRRGMYEAMGERDIAILEQVHATSLEYFKHAVADGSYRSWFALQRDRIVGGAGVLVSPWPSHPYDGECRRAT